MDKKSKFHGFAYPVDGKEQISAILENLNRRFPKANHICYAWQTGVEKSHYRVNDDGEPKNTAGTPIYGQILSFGLTNVVVSVVRIFGGTKLGVGGLINAYRSTAKLALEASTIVELPVTLQLRLFFGYGDLNKVMRVIKQRNLAMVSQQLEINCVFTLKVQKRDLDSVLENLAAIRELKIQQID